LKTDERYRPIGPLVMHYLLTDFGQLFRRFHYHLSK